MLEDVQIESVVEGGSKPRYHPSIGQHLQGVDEGRRKPSLDMIPLLRWTERTPHLRVKTDVSVEGEWIQ